MPGKRKATNKSVDAKEAKEAAHKTKATKKTKSDEEEEMEEEVETKNASRSSRSKSKETAPASKSKEKKTPPKKGKGKKDEESEEEESDEEPIPKKAVKGKGKNEDEEEEEKKGKGKSGASKEKAKPSPKKTETKEEKKEDKAEEETDKKGRGRKAAAPKAEEGKGNSRKLNRNRSELEDDTVADEIKDPDFELGDGKIPDSEIIISSWNVAGLTGMLKKTHLQDYLKERKPHILALNETKFTPDTQKAAGTAWIPEGYTSYFNNCKIKKGYSGTAIITKYKPEAVHFGIGVSKHDKEGRTITLEFEHFYIVSCYVPNAGEKLVGLDYRVKEWDLDFSAYLNKLKAKKHVILCGDLNVAHGDIDIYETKGKHKFAGFTPEERKGFGELLGTGWVDTFRHLHPKDQKFSYFSARFPKLKAENRGWRLDYFVIDKEGLGGVKDSLINEKINGSDHLPIELVLNPHFK